MLKHMYSLLRNMPATELCQHFLEFFVRSSRRYHQVGGTGMGSERQVRFFRNGRNQAIRIPREFELDADEAIIRREVNCLVIEPVPKKGLLATLAALSAIEDDFPDVDAGMPALDDVRL
jgi:antitoxin VapB